MNVLKTLRKPFLAIIIVVPSLTSCSYEDSQQIEKTIDLSEKVLTSDELNSITLNINTFKINSLISKSLSVNNEEEMRIILEPLVENGRSLHNEIISQIDFYDPQYELTQEDIDEIQNLNDEQLAQLSFVMSTTYSNVVSYGAPNPTVRACLAVAVGIAGLSDLIANTAALGTAETTIAALRLIGRRYLGWIGVGLMVYDFMDCYYGLKD